MDWEIVMVVVVDSDWGRAVLVTILVVRYILEPNLCHLHGHIGNSCLLDHNLAQWYMCNSPDCQLDMVQYLVPKLYCCTLEVHHNLK